MSRDPRHFRSAPRPVSVAAVQMAWDWDIEGNVARAERLARQAAARGAQISLATQLVAASDSRIAPLVVGICWDPWFPETARVMALRGAELLMFPTAIGTEPPPALPVNSREHWQRTQQGHAAANLTPLIASNRYGLERSLQDPEGLYIRFYGSSFIADAMGAKVEEAPEEGDAVLTHTFDLAEAAQLRDNWFVFRDRRPDLYGALTSLDGRRTD